MILNEYLQTIYEACLFSDDALETLAEYEAMWLNHPQSALHAAGRVSLILEKLEISLT